jgi:hypothetical protein
LVAKRDLRTAAGEFHGNCPADVSAATEDNGKFILKVGHNQFL